jgi:hypothetical protein
MKAVDAGLGHKLRVRVRFMTMLTELSCEVSDSLVSGDQPIKKSPIEGGQC